MEEGDRTVCEGLITANEVSRAIDGLKRGKSPGLDGLSHGFYKDFKEDLVPLLCKLYNDMFEDGRLSEGFAVGVVTLLFKNKGNKLELENYRPLTLLNTDYKILSKILANRLKWVLPSIIGKEQAYAVPGRSVEDNICSLRDTIYFLTQYREGELS